MQSRKLNQQPARLRHAVKAYLFQALDAVRCKLFELLVFVNALDKISHRILRELCSERLGRVAASSGMNAPCRIWLRLLPA